MDGCIARQRPIGCWQIFVLRFCLFAIFCGTSELFQQTRSTINIETRKFLPRHQDGLDQGGTGKDSDFFDTPASKGLVASSERISGTKDTSGAHSEIFLQDTAKRKRARDEEGRSAAEILRGATERELEAQPDDTAARAAGRLTVRELKERLRLLGVCESLLDGCRGRAELVQLFARTRGAMIDAVRTPRRASPARARARDTPDHAPALRSFPRGHIETARTAPGGREAAPGL